NRRSRMIGFCQFGAGRIGAIHAGNIVSHHDARLQFVVDPDRAAAQRLAGRHGAAVGSQAEALADPTVNAVVIASSTDTHADLVEAAARAGKAVFCEKPLDLDRSRAEACVAVAEECGVPLMVGFNRRFDPNFALLERQIRDGRIGRLELLTITSRDPAPPPIESPQSRPQRTRRRHGPLSLLPGALRVYVARAVVVLLGAAPRPSRSRTRPPIPRTTHRTTSRTTWRDAAPPGYEPPATRDQK